MLDENISLQHVLLSLEGNLKINPKPEDKVNDIIKESLSTLSDTYRVTFDKPIAELQAENQLTAENLNILIRDLRQSLAEMALFNNLKVFHKNVPITLAGVNYLGLGRVHLIRAIKRLQDDSTYQQYAEEVMPSLKAAVDNIPMSTVKRLFLILFMIYELGMDEGVAVVAQTLYLGGLCE